jgi:class 3 adenylate cyclase
MVNLGWPHLLPRLIGAGALAIGDHSRAEHWLTLAKVTADRAGMMPELAKTLLSLARLELARGDPGSIDRGVELAIDAIGMLSALGLNGLVESSQRMWNEPAVLEAIRGSVQARTAFILFTDIVDSTATTAAVGDPRWVRMLADHDRLIRESVRRFGGREIKHTGDGFCVRFDTARDAVQSALDMQSSLLGWRGSAPAASLHIRCGIASGPTFAYGGDIHGLAVPMAARVCAYAGTDEICLSDAVGRAVLHDINLTSIDDVVLKGIPGKQRLYRVGR